MTQLNQFEPNNDFPDGEYALASPTFPSPEINECDRITTRVLYGNGATTVYQNVLVPCPTTDELEQEVEATHNAYVILPGDPIRTAIYGSVLRGIVLRRYNPPQNTYTGQSFPQWRWTTQRCAIKEMDLQKIQAGLNMNKSENPIKEMATMQYLQEHINQDNTDIHLMLPLDVMQDEQHLYCIMPLMDNGDLFDYWDDKCNENGENGGTFTEEQCRYWLDQLLLGIEQMQNAGVCHRDISFENVMVDDQYRAIIIDWGMALKIPYRDGDAAPSNIEAEDTAVRAPPRQRCLIRRNERCGKLKYMSPEVYNSETSSAQPYDGHAVDLWAVGVMLFAMATGQPPWDIPHLTDQRFAILTDSNRYLARTVKSWEMELSDELLDLMERMLLRNPHERLSLSQIRNHPWMINGGRVP